MWKVAIIEDDRVDREIYKRCLRHSTAFEFDFAEAGSAAEGIELSRRWSPDCILLDFHLPDMDGLEVLRRLRGESDRPPCAIVMLTACGGEELAVNAMKSGAMDYLPKGQVSAEVLVHTALNAIERFQMLQRIEDQRSAVERSARQCQNLLNAIPQMVWMADPEGRVGYANGQWFEYTGLGISEAGPVGWDDLLHPEDRERTLNAWTQARQAGSVFEIEHRLRRAADGSFRWHLVRAIPFRDDAGQVRNWFGTCTEIENQKQAEAVNLQNEKLHSIGQLAAGMAHEFNNLLVVILGGASQVLERLPPSHNSRDTLQDVVRAGERAAELTRKMLAYAGKANLYMEPTDLNKLVRDTCDSLRTLVPQAIQLNISAGRDLPAVATDSRQMRQVIVDLLTNALEAIREGAAGTISVRTARTEVGEGDMPALRAGKYVELEVLDTGCGMNEETQKKIFDPFFTTKFTGRGLGLAAVQGFVRSSGGGVDVDSAPGRGTRFRILLPAMPQIAPRGA
jgi:two-component system cell cycle sensor histidine kinase/response regulator CckA